MIAARSDPAIEALPEAASDEIRALVFAKAIARRAVLDWEGVGDAEGHGRAARAMLRAFEAWADSRGADRVVMACLDDRAGLLYARGGYEATPERHWVRALR